jgi:hypothetical protein
VPHLQLKDLPGWMHDAVRARAARSGVSMREYVLRLIEQDLGRRDTPEEMRARLASLPRARRAPDSAVVLREARADRDAELQRRIGSS